MCRECKEQIRRGDHFETFDSLNGLHVLISSELLKIRIDIFAREVSWSNQYDKFYDEQSQLPN